MAFNFKPKFIFDRFSIKRDKILEANRKVFYNGTDSSTYILSFKENSHSHEPALNNRISSSVFSRLADIGISNHFKRSLNMREQLVYQADPLVFSVTAHNIVSPELSRRLEIEEGLILNNPVLEFSLKSGAIIGENHIFSMGWASENEMDILSLVARRVNDFMHGYLNAFNLRPVNITMEFGRFHTTEFSDLIMIDEISPATFAVCSLLDTTILDKDTVYEIFKRQYGTDIQESIS
jgi:phosphoribosylaminoimidazole-succinocarboxamide synthase